MRRKLRIEGLEGRELLAADVGLAPAVDDAAFVASDEGGGRDIGDDVIWDIVDSFTDDRTEGGGRDIGDDVIWDIVDSATDDHAEDGGEGDDEPDFSDIIVG